jgi:phosphonate transport system substrate-binding protein
MKRRSVCLLLVLHTLGPARPLSAAEPDPKVFRVALLPDESPSTIIQNNQGLEAYLEKALGRPVELVVTTDYGSMIEAMRFGRLELAYFGPLSYLLAKSRSDLEAFAALVVDGSASYTSYLIGNAAAGVTTAADVKGKTVAFGDPASTSSHLVPRSLLKDKGLNAGVDYKFQHLGNHDAVARAVEAGHAQAGGISRPIFERLVEKKTIDPTRVKPIAESGPIPNYPWTMRADLSPALKATVRKAFLELKDPAVLQPFKGQGFKAVTDADYEVLRKLSRSLALDLGKLSK